MTNSIENNLLERFVQARKKSQHDRNREKEWLDSDKNINTGMWGFYQSRIEVYERAFSLLRIDSIHSLLESRKKKGLLTYVVDLASAGQAVLDIAQKGLLTAGLSVAYNDPNKDNVEIQGLYQHLYVEVLEGNLLYGKTWADIKTWLKTNNTAGVDLLLHRGGSGLPSAIGEHNPVPELYWMLGERALSLLNSGGIFLTDAPSGFSLQPWIDDLNRRPDFRVKYPIYQGPIQVTRIA